jgi:hypothetical protein
MCPMCLCPVLGGALIASISGGPFRCIGDVTKEDADQGGRVRVTTASPLRAAAGSVIAGQACSLMDLTVLAPNDPSRLGTPARYLVGLRAPARIEDISHCT